ncbi:tripartite tricarboxylate transporter substrate binding protein [Curvibacter sp. RS43]|uniref:Bug family tripartite tricarboxylate transporter substrate binding protein n=1 Tax=Curvibacter microcysteis TaxID=3026419 RepID=UPI00235E0919|nr:tripartite tricarboxylate transporter substrate binding protein [Curvibacter sp. RS43]MDD0809018.1 tripartite tricarboxylate transporter substrate binding protein [Curvibacter sp. RS43]
MTPQRDPGHALRAHAPGSAVGRLTRRRRLLTTGLALLTALAGLSALRPAQAQDAWPNRPIRLVVPFTPGGVTDTSGRLIAEQLGRRLGQSVIVDNRPGASGNIGTAAVATAAPDGYTLVLGFDGTLVINPHVFAKVPFDTLKDLAPVGKIGDAVLILVAHPGVPAKTLGEVIALSKSQADGLSYGTSGTGGTPHIGGELLRQRTGAQLTHIPYKGGGQAMSDVLGGSIPLVYTAVAGASGHVKSGKLRAIAVSSAQRSAALPDVPTFIESGVSDFVVNSWVGLLAPAKTPPAVLARLNTELNAVLNDPAVREKLIAMGIEATPGSADQFRDEIRRDLARYGQVVKAAGIRIE